MARVHVTIQFIGAGYAYPASDEPVLRDVSFSVQPRELTVVTGLLGAGCSTLLLLASGFAPRISGGNRQGTVVTLDRDPGSPEGWAHLAGRIGVLLPTPWTQLSGMSYTVADEVAFGPANLGRPAGVVREAAADAMTRLGVLHLADRDPATLSGGELQRVILAGLVAMAPEIYLLDEPVMELDPEAAESVYAFLGTLAETATVLVATTDVDRVAGVADRIVYLEAGRVAADGTAAEVLGSEPIAAAGAGGTVAALFRDAGAVPRYPVTLADALSRCG